MLVFIVYLLAIICVDSLNSSNRLRIHEPIPEQTRGYTTIITSGCCVLDFMIIKQKIGGIILLQLCSCDALYCLNTKIGDRAALSLEVSVLNTHRHTFKQAKATLIIPYAPSYRTGYRQASSTGYVWLAH